jgi:hypothetical protein
VTATPIPEIASQRRPPMYDTKTPLNAMSAKPQRNTEYGSEKTARLSNPIST